MLETLAQHVPPTPQGLCQEMPEGNTKRPRPGQATPLSHPWAAPFPTFQGKRGTWGEFQALGCRRWQASGYPGDDFLFTEDTVGRVERGFLWCLSPGPE